MIRILTYALTTVFASVVLHGAAHAQSRHSPRNDADNDTARTITFEREVFRYSADGRRDPFVSLTKSNDLRPVLTDLRLTTVALDPTGRNSVAVLRDITTKEQYRVKAGSQLGRMRVVRIDQKSVTFAIEEFGFSRQETLAMGDSTRTRTP